MNVKKNVLGFCLILLACVINLEPSIAEQVSTKNYDLNSSGDKVDFIPDVPLYKGFPVYPPESIDELIAGDGDSLTVDVVKEHWHEKNILDNKKDMSSETFFELFKKAKEEDVIRKKPFYDKRNKAINYVKSNAKKLGWILSARASYMDGGSVAENYIKIVDNNLVNVRFFTKVGVSSPFPASYLSEDFGKLTYTFLEKPAPVLNDGFPMPFNDSNLLIGQQSAYETTFFFSEDEIIYDNSTMMTLPEMFGWKPIISPLLGGYDFLFEKDNNVVKFSLKPYDVKNKTAKRYSYKFYSVEKASKVIDKYPQKLYIKKVFPKGDIITGGKYIRRPYVLELKDNKMLINGVLFKKFDYDRIYELKKHGALTYDYLSNFEHMVKRFDNEKTYIYLIDDETGSEQPIRFDDDEDMQRFLKKIDSIMLHSVNKEEDLKAMDIESFVVEDILKYWDGLD